MSKNCPMCGALVDDGARFCGNCGADMTAQPVAPQTLNYQYTSAPTQALPVGYSDRVNDPEILKAVKKNKKIGGIIGVIIVFLPLIGFTIYSMVSDKMEPKQGVTYGAFISAVFLLFALISAIKNRSANAYDAIVTDKKTRTRHHHSNSDNDDMETYIEYITYARTTDGKKKKIVEQEGSRIIAYNYLQIGDRFMYHPQFNFQYEHYDKSKAPYIGCVSCCTKNSPGADRCEKCGLPLLK